MCEPNLLNRLFFWWFAMRIKRMKKMRDRSWTKIKYKLSENINSGTSNGAFFFFFFAAMTGGHKWHQRNQKNEMIKICCCYFSAAAAAVGWNKSQRWTHSITHITFISFLFQLCGCEHCMVERTSSKNIIVAFVLKCLRHKYSLLLRITSVFHNNPLLVFWPMCEHWELHCIMLTKACDSIIIDEL